MRGRISVGPCDRRSHGDHQRCRSELKPGDGNGNGSLRPRLIAVGRGCQRSGQRGQQRNDDGADRDPPGPEHCSAAGINGDAFSDEVKGQTLELVRRDIGKLDLVIYSLAAPRRLHPRKGKAFQAVLKTIGEPYRGKTVDFASGAVTEAAIEAADEEEVAATIAVMGGEDWRFWIDALGEQDLLAEGARTLAYSYVGPKLTWPIYRQGTIGAAKKDLERTAGELNALLASRLGGGARVSVNKAVVTQASVAIPVVPLYISLLLRVMKQKGVHEGCIEQMQRLCFGHLANGRELALDGEGLMRLDDLELRDDVQTAVAGLWEKVSTENLEELSDIAGFRREFNNLFGFDLEGVDYAQPTETDLPL